MQHHSYREKTFLWREISLQFLSYRNHLKQILFFLLLFYEVVKKLGLLTILVSNALLV